VRADPGAEVFVFGEARFGAKPALGRRWAEKGERPVAVVRSGYKNFYAYSTVCPAASGVQEPHLTAGEDFTLLLPWVDTRAMNAFLGEMAKALGGVARLQGPAGAAEHQDRVSAPVLPGAEPRGAPVEVDQVPRRAEPPTPHAGVGDGRRRGVPAGRHGGVFQEHLPM
jgi:hypothetical protein